MSRSEPLAVPAPELEPVPVEGCTPCGAADTARDRCRQRGDLAGVRKFSGIIATHPHRRTGGPEGERRTGRDDNPLRFPPCQCPNQDCPDRGPPQPAEILGVPEPAESPPDSPVLTALRARVRADNDRRTG